MSLDDFDLPPRVAHRRLRHYYTEEDHQDWLVQQQCESVEAEEAKWSRIFTRQAAEVGPVYWDDRPGIDRRVFAVEGDAAEAERRDREHHEVPW